MKRGDHIKIKIQKFVRDKIRELDKKYEIINTNNEKSLKEARRLMELKQDNATLNYDLNHKILDAKISALSKIVYIGIGVVLVIEIIFKIYFK